MSGGLLVYGPFSCLFVSHAELEFVPGGGGSRPTVPVPATPALPATSLERCSMDAASAELDEAGRWQAEIDRLIRECDEKLAQLKHKHT